MNTVIAIAIAMASSARARTTAPHRAPSPPRRLRSTAAAAALMLPRLLDLFAVLVALILFFAWLGVRSYLP